MQTLKEHQFPDFSKQGYQIIRELGHNFSGGRATYLATEIATGQSVVIKLFSFSSSGANWSNYNALQREIEVLQRLNHPGIPKYLETIETPAGFCLIQEYKNANSLEVSRHFSPTSVQKIAASVLEILVYLQQQVPPVIHKDIKPGNILVDSEINVFLVDFGFASSSDREIPASSVVKGTLGFMAPEQLFGRKLCAASDLYGLGVTLICLLTGTPSTEIGSLMDEEYRIRWELMVPTLNPGFVKWLGRMVARKLGDRFTDAVNALNGLRSLEHHLRLAPQNTPFQLLGEDEDNEYADLETQTSLLSKVRNWIAPVLIVGTLVTGAIGISTIGQDPALPPLIVIPTEPISKPDSTFLFSGLEHFLTYYINSNYQSSVHLSFTILRIMIGLIEVTGWIRLIQLVHYEEEWIPTARLVFIVLLITIGIDTFGTFLVS